MTLECGIMPPRPKKMQRGTLSITESILQAISASGITGINATRVATASGLAYVDTLKKCQELVDAEFVESWREERSLLFRITHKGLHFFCELQRFLNVARSANLRC